jgi:hypothetical protein
LLRDLRHLPIFFSSFLAGIRTDTSGPFFSVCRGRINLETSLYTILFIIKFNRIKARKAVIAY